MNKDFNEFKSYIKGKKVAVIGIGVSNKPLIHFLLQLGAEVSAFDKKNKEALGYTADELIEKGVNLILGEDYLDNLNGYDVIFKTPSMRIDSAALLRAKDNGAYITSEMEEFVKYCKGKVIGVTGSDGKTTTTSIIYKMYKEAGYNTWVGGNIGNPLFSVIEDIKEDHIVVLELSSFQLMTMSVSPQVSIITNLSPNHLDMHKDMQEYIDAKKNIYKYQGRNDVLILNEDNVITKDMTKEAMGKVRKFSTKQSISHGAYYEDGSLYVNDKKVCNKDDVLIKGMYNVENYLAAFCAVSDDVDIEVMKNVAQTFVGVEHRSEFVREKDGVKYYNNSIATSPTRVLANLNSFDKPVVLIAGGYDKKIPLEPLAEQGYSLIKGLVLVGATKEKLKDIFEKVKKDKKLNLPIVITESLEEAVKEAANMAVPGDIVTLSPACASFDMFPNFEDRGNKYKNLVNNL